MPSKTKMRNAQIAARSAALQKVSKELLDQLVGDGAPMTAEQINATTMALKKALIERALGGELSHHLEVTSTRSCIDTFASTPRPGS